METYICLNHGECLWADEQPPRTFSLPNSDENVCPNCGSTNVKVPVSSPAPPRKLILAGLLLAALLLAILWFKIGNEKKLPPPFPPDTITKIDRDKRKTLTPTGPEKGENPPLPQPPRVVWTRVAGSDECLVDECTLEYKETDNLGHIRERRILNYTNCCRDTSVTNP
jgi:hypothetical protein